MVTSWQAEVQFFRFLSDHDYLLKIGVHGVGERDRAREKDGVRE